jgi:hypothetical protein
MTPVSVARLDDSVKPRSGGNCRHRRALTDAGSAAPRRRRAEDRPIDAHGNLSATGGRAVTRRAEPDAPPVREDGLQISEDRALQERFWTMERVAHGSFGVLVALGLLGLSGAGGPLSVATATSEGGSVRYARLARWETPSEMTVRFAAQRPVHRLTLIEPSPERFLVEGVQPQPARALATPEGLVLEFDAAEVPGARVTLRLRATRPGPSRLGVRVDDAAPVPLTGFVLP